jgi:sulfide:quinone oxidoreductase
LAHQRCGSGRPCPVFAKKGINFKPVAAKKLLAESNAIELEDGSSINYDFLIIATGPELAFDEIEGLGPSGFTQSICHVDHAEQAHEAFEAFCKNPGPIIVGAVQGASCFGPAYEFTFILETELRRRKIRDRVPMTFGPRSPISGISALMAWVIPRGLKVKCASTHIKWMTSTGSKG